MKKSDKKEEKEFLPFAELQMSKQLDLLKVVVKKYTKENAPISYRDVSDIHATKPRVSGSLSFFAKIGWLEQHSKGKYIPSSSLIHYFEGLDKEKARQELAQILITKSKVAEKIKFFVEQKDNVKKEEIIKYLASQFRFLEKHKKSIERMIELLLMLKILKTDGKGQYTSEDVMYSPPQEIQEGQKHNSKERIKLINTKQGLNICIGIMLTPEMPEEQMRRAIQIVLEEIRKMEKE